MFANTRKTILFSNNNKPKYIYSVWALAWKKNILNQGGTIDDSNLQTIDTHIFKPALANGNIYNQLDRFNIYAGLVGHQGAARTCTIRNTSITRVNSPTFDINGYKSAGTSYLNLNYNPFTQSVKFTRDNAIFGCIVKNPTFSATIRMIGGRSTGVITESYRLAGPSRYAGQINDGGVGATANTNVVTSGNVFLATIRTSSTAIKNIINTNEQSGITTSTGLPNTQMFELTHSNSGSPLGNYDDNYHLASFHGSSNLDYQSLRIFLNNYFTAIGI
jgi:hypothetical protein